MSDKICFGAYELDRDAVELRKHGVPIRLQEQPFRVLVLLAERPGQVITREELQEQIWGNTFVDFDQSLNKAVNRLREALNDDAGSPQYVETVPRRGYRFIAPVLEAPQAKAHGPAEPVRLGYRFVRTGLLALFEYLSRMPDHRRTAKREAEIPKTKKLSVTLKLLLGALIPLVPLGAWIAHSRYLHVEKGPGKKRILSQITVRGSVEGLVFSPDGQQLAFTADGDAWRRKGLFVELLGSGSVREVAHIQSGSICCSGWSPDASQIAFVHCDEGGTNGEILVVPPLGGSQHKLMDISCNTQQGNALQWTSEGVSIVYLDQCSPGGPVGVVASSMLTGERRCLDLPEPNSWDDWPRLSPDGKTVAFIRMTHSTGDLYVVPFTGGPAKRLVHEISPYAGFIKWKPDGQHIVFATSGNSNSSVPVHGGNIGPETAYPIFGAVSRDGRRIAEIGFKDWRKQLWSARLSVPGGKVLALAKTLPPNMIYDSQLAPDGRHIAYSLFSYDGEPNLWTSKIDGSERTQLTRFESSDHSPHNPRWSPDGMWIAFAENHQGHIQISVVDAEGRNIQAVTPAELRSDFPSWSRDGKAIYYLSNRSGTWQTWRQEIATGALTQITKDGAVVPHESYDGKTLYFAPTNGIGISSRPLEGGLARRIMNPLQVGWDVTETGIYLVDIEDLFRPKIDFYDFKMQKMKTVLQLEKPSGQWQDSLRASRDGRTLIFSQLDLKNTITVTTTENPQ